MKNTSRKYRVGAVLLMGILLASVWIAASPARAEFIGLVTVTATNSHGSASVDFDPLSHLPPQANVPPQVRVKLAARVKMRSQGKVIGTIDELIIDMDGDPIVEFEFGATAGNSDTVFTIMSSVVSFDTLTDPTGSALASLILTDNDGDGASISAVPPDTGLVQAMYNGNTLFQELIFGAMFGAGGETADFSQEQLPVTIAGGVENIRVELEFELSAHDTVSGIGRFEVLPQNAAIPEPSTFVLLGMAAVGLPDDPPTATEMSRCE